MAATRHGDVVVVGGGPAGSAAAITLARLGRRVTVVEKAALPRDKCCGDGLTTAALRRLDGLGLRPQQVASWTPVDDIVVAPAHAGTIELPLPGGDQGLFAASARRRDLDAALVAVARRAGAEVREGRAVTGVGSTPGGDGVEVELAGGEVLAASYVIAADGMWSPVRKLLGLTEAGYLGEWQAGRHYLANTGPETKKLWVWFEPEMLPGYAWSFPLGDGTVNVGYGVLRSSGTAFKGQKVDWTDYPRIAEVLGPDTEEVGPWRAWPIPARIGSAALSGLGGRVLFVGDAAGACDIMTGEGVAQALETGELAARAAAQAGPDDPAGAGARYRRQIRWGMALDDRLAKKLSEVLARPGGSARAMAIVGRSERRRRHFARWMFEDYPRAILATPHRWRRPLLTAPGAWAGTGRRAVGHPAAEP